MPFWLVFILNKLKAELAHAVLLFLVDKLQGDKSSSINKDGDKIKNILNANTVNGKPVSGKTPRESIHRRRNSR